MTTPTQAEIDTQLRNKLAADQALADQMQEMQIEAIKEGTGGFSAPEWFKASGDVGDAMKDGEYASSGVFAVNKTNHEKITIYSNIDGTPSTVLVSMLAKTMKKRLPDGRPAFSLTEVERPKTGDFKCLLHPEHERNAELREIGVGIGAHSCRKTGIPNTFEVRLHMQRKHKREWEAIQQMEQERRDQEAREEQRAMLKAMQGMGRGR